MSWALVLLPVALLSLFALLSTTVGQPGPFSGMALNQLEATLRWLLALIVLLIAMLFLFRHTRRLWWAGYWRAALAVLLVILGAATVRFAVMLSFINQNYATEFLMFAAATPDTALVMDELNEMSRRLGGSQPLTVAYDNESQQPFFWYLRDRENVVFFTGESGLSGDPDIVIIGHGNESKVKSQLAGKYLRRDYRLIWWPDESVYRNLTPAKLRNDLKDPGRRRYWWDILWHRKYPQSTTAWPLVHKFAMHVRRDLAARVWPAGSEVAAPALALPEEEYERQRGGAVQLPQRDRCGRAGECVRSGQLQSPRAGV